MAEVLDSVVRPDQIPVFFQEFQRVFDGAPREVSLEDPVICRIIAKQHQSCPAALLHDAITVIEERLKFYPLWRRNEIPTLGAVEGYLEEAVKLV